MNKLVRHPLVAYFAIAYTGSWLVWSPVLLSNNFGSSTLDLPTILAIMLVLFGTLTGPMLAAGVVITLVSGAQGRQKLWHRIIRWRFRPVWYLVPLLLMLVANALADLVALALFAPDRVSPALSAIPGNLFTLVGFVPTTLFLVIGTMPEEIGWRGFALPRLQRAIGPLKGTLMLGFLWGCWHLPLLVWSQEWRGEGHPMLAYTAGYIPMVMALAVFSTVVFNRTGGSLLATALLHSAFNSASNFAGTLLFGEFGSTGGVTPMMFFGMFVVIFVFLAVVVILMTRGRLGYLPQPIEPKSKIAPLTPEPNLT